MKKEDCRYQYIYPRKSYKKSRWLKAWKRYHERIGCVIGKKRHILGHK